MHSSLPRSPAPPRSSRTPETSDANTPSIVYETNGFVIASWKNFGINVWATRATIPLCEKLDEQGERMLMAYPAGISTIHVITREAAPPEEDVREVLRDLTKKYGKHLACLCHVVEGSGFWASALQSFVTGLHLGNRDSFETHVCSSIAKAARRVPEAHARRTGVHVGVEDFEAVVTSVRDRIR